MKITIKLIVIISFFTIKLFAQKPQKDYTAFVNPFIGTGGHGHTYPGAVVPFGMVQLSPDTRLVGWDACSGYHYTDTIVYGFSHTHLSGTGIADYFDVLFMPTTGEPKISNIDYRSPFKKRNEKAHPGYYETTLDKYGINVQLTATKRVGMHKYRFPDTHECNIIIDLNHRDQVLDSWVQIVNDHEIKGLRRSKSWAKDQYVYFYAKFSKPFKKYGLFSDDKLMIGEAKVTGINIKLFLQFDNPHEVISKVGISSVSIEGALKNLDAEVPDFNFEKVKKLANESWASQLSKIDIETVSKQSKADGFNLNHKQTHSLLRYDEKEDSTKEQKKIFYTALYHSMCAPNIYNDIDGKYRGLDQKIHIAKGFNYYTVFSLWDTYRAEHPLQNIINRTITLDFVKTFLAMYEDVGLLPVWPLGSSETYCMVGNHAIPVIVDAYAKGIRDFDAEKALAAMKTSVNRNEFGLDSYRKNGVVLATDERESVSKTLEYAIDDWCIARMAKMMDKTADYIEYSKRGQYWKNVFDNQTNFMRSRNNGGWLIPFLPTDINYQYTEGNSWQYSFLVPHDVDGLIRYMGGKHAFETKLDELFTTKAKLTGKPQLDVTGLIGQYAHGNEPSHHMAYLFNYTDSAYKTQFYINKIMREEYRNAPDGLAGNEDCGQMSAWYVLSALGFYNIAPGQNDFQIGLPLFKEAKIHLNNGKTFTIIKHNLRPEDNYIQKMTLNNQPYTKLYLTDKEMQNGGQWQVITGEKPSVLLYSKLKPATSQITNDSIVPNPYIIYPSITFQDSISVSIGCAQTEAKIHYTLDGSMPTSQSMLFNKPLNLKTTTTVKCIAIKDNVNSIIDEGTFTKIRNDIKIVSLSMYNTAYAADGKNALIDGIKGGRDWRMGNWQGFQGNDLEVVLDVQNAGVIKQIGLNTMEDPGAKILFPRNVEVYTSEDGINFKSVAVINYKSNPSEPNPKIHLYATEVVLNTKFIKIVARQTGHVTDINNFADNQSLILADEILIN